MNIWTGIGNLGKENEVKFSQTGTAVLNQSLAVRRSFKNKQTNEYETDWINISMFGKTAENFANFTQKGSKVGIEGRIQTRSYESNQGQRIYVTEVVVENFYFLEPKGSQQSYAQDSQVMNNQSLPF